MSIHIPLTTMEVLVPLSANFELGHSNNLVNSPKKGHKFYLVLIILRWTRLCWFLRKVNNSFSDMNCFI